MVTEEAEDAPEVVMRRAARRLRAVSVDGERPWPHEITVDESLGASLANWIEAAAAVSEECPGIVRDVGFRRLMRDSGQGGAVDFVLGGLEIARVLLGEKEV